MENTNKTAIIVGASSGIGLETAKLLIENGYTVTNISRTRSPKDIDMNDIYADASIENTVYKAIESASNGKDIGVFIYCAGWSMASPIEFAKQSDYRYLFDVNFFGIAESMQTVIPLMKKKGGRIILLSSLAGTLPIAFDAYYSASKAAIDAFAQAADIELSPYNIRVCAIKPPGVNTRFTFKRKVYDDKKIGEYAKKQHKAVRKLAAIEQGGLQAKVVAKTVFSVIESSNPPTKRVVGLMGKTYYTAAKILPDRLIGFLNKKEYLQQ